MTKSRILLFKNLTETIQSLNISSIPKERKVKLQEIIDYLTNKLSRDEEVKLNFICTHNSRRSQFAQIWSQTAADYHGVPVKCYSGGVEVTAFNERAVNSLKRAGFRITKKGGDNPVYFIFHSEGSDPMNAFSKHFDDPINPPSGYGAIMTCADADENCPFIPGAEERISLPYEDPKAFDHTSQEEEKYDERSLQIAAEMYYVFSKINSKTHGKN